MGLKDKKVLIFLLAVDNEMCAESSVNHLYHRIGMFQGAIPFNQSYLVWFILFTKKYL